MQIILVKYIQLVCVTLSFSNQVNCDKLFLQNDKEDRQIYETTACSARCLDNNHNMTLENCFTECQKQIINTKNLKKIYENLDTKFLCRDSTSLAFEIIQRDFGHLNQNLTNLTSTLSNINNSSPTSSSLLLINDTKLMNAKIFIFKVLNANNPQDQQRVLSDSSLIKLENLKPNTAYNITATVVHSNSAFSLISNNLQFTTLKTTYEPGQVKKITLVRYEQNESDKKYLKGIINWIPANDMTCYYDILFYSPQGGYDMTAIEIRDLKHLYTYAIEPFHFGIEYTIGIRSKNTKDFNKESTLKYLPIKTPSCLEWNHNDLTICPPLEPKGLMAVEKIISNNEFSINITWTKPTIDPDYYIVKIFDLDLKSEIAPNSLTMNVSKDQNYLFVQSMELNGHEYEVNVFAFSIGGNSSSMISIPLKNLQIADKHHSLKLVVAIILPLTFFALISMLTFIMCHRRARTKRYKERCKYFEELEKKAPMDPNSNFEFSTKNLSVDQLTQLQYDLEDKLFFNDHMEVNRCDIELFEVLGEGAFGLVRRGNIKMSEKNEIEVAVKMLKDHPSVDDLKGFRREIEVMKSVGKHPNIVGIIGHYTKNVNDMLLLTEFCSLGNLLNYLRTEWNYINKIIYIQKSSMSLPNSPISLPTILNKNEQKSSEQNESNENMFNFDSSFVDKISLKYKNINDDHQSNLINNKFVFVNNQGYDYNNTITKTSPTLPTSQTTPNINSTCTNFCKCHVDVVTKKLCLNSMESSFTTSTLNEIHISKNCECKLNDNKTIIKINNNNNQNFNSNFNNHNNNNNNNDEHLNKTQFDPLMVETKGYYKLIQNHDDNNDNDNYNDNNEQDIQDRLFAKQEPLTSRDLLLIAKQIALGMEFLSKCKVVHRDLAARNVLVCQDKTVKIADFGLSRDVYQENVYKKTGNGKLPIKWLALESMTHQVYTTQSDVWSYGILLFEIATLGGTPYPAIPTNHLVSILKSGYRMEKPKNCSKSLYNLMSSCWKTAPSERPTFLEICQTLDEMLLELSENELENLGCREIEKSYSMKSGSDESYLNPII